MKKIIVTLAVCISSLGLVSASDTASVTGEESVDARVLNAFQHEFVSASDIIWTIAPHFYQASFVYQDQHLTAYYNRDGEFLGVTRFIRPADLPLALQSDLKKNHADYWISNLFEVSNEAGTSYYITLEDADNSIVLKSSNAHDWVSYKRVKKS